MCLKKRRSCVQLTCSGVSLIGWENPLPGRGRKKKKNPKKKTMTMVIALTLSEIVITFSFILEQLELGTSVKTCFRNIFGELFGSEGCH